jgi:hypothetical protein
MGLKGRLGEGRCGRSFLFCSFASKASFCT